MRHHPHMTVFLATGTPILGEWSTWRRARGNDNDRADDKKYMMTNIIAFCFWQLALRKRQWGGTNRRKKQRMALWWWPSGIANVTLPTIWLQPIHGWLSTSGFGLFLSIFLSYFSLLLLSLYSLTSCVYSFVHQRIYIITTTTRAGLDWSASISHSKHRKKLTR